MNMVNWLDPKIWYSKSNINCLGKKNWRYSHTLGFDVGWRSSLVAPTLVQWKLGHWLPSMAEAQEQPAVNAGQDMWSRGHVWTNFASYCFKLWQADSESMFCLSLGLAFIRSNGQWWGSWSITQKIVLDSYWPIMESNYLPHCRAMQFKVCIKRLGMYLRMTTISWWVISLMPIVY